MKKNLILIITINLLIINLIFPVHGTIVKNVNVFENQLELTYGKNFENNFKIDFRFKNIVSGALNLLIRNELKNFDELKTFNIIKKESLLNYPKNDYILHDPIIIDNNNDFTIENGVVSGSGTEIDPYIIEGWEIETTSNNGIRISDTTLFFIIRNCFIQNEYGVNFNNIQNGVVTDNFFYCNSLAIKIYSSSNINIFFSEMNFEGGVSITKSTIIRIDNCKNISSNFLQGNGVKIEFSSDVILSNLSISNCFSGLYITDSSHININNCDIFSNNVGINNIYSPYLTMKNNSFYDNINGIGLIYGSTTEDFYLDIDISNTINGDPIYYIRNENNLIFDGNENIGFLGLVECNNITIRNFTPKNNEIGLLLAGSNFSTIDSSEFNENPVGIILFDSNDNLVKYCNFNFSSIYLENSGHNEFKNNALIDSGLSVEGVELEHYYQNIDTSNTINSKPIYYYVEQDDIEFSETEVGFLAFINCNNILVTDVNIHYCIDGILLGATSGIIKNSEFFYNQYAGVFIFGESDLEFINCNIHDDAFGVVMVHASGVTFSECNISAYLVGLDLEDCYSNAIKNCDINNIGYNSFQIHDSRDNIVSSNNIFNLNQGAFCIDGNSYYNKISKNKIYNSYSGLHLLGDSPGINSPHDNDIFYNVIYNIELLGIGLDFADNNFIYRNSIHDCRFGFYVTSNNKSRFYKNNIFDNYDGNVAENCIVDARSNWWGSEDGPSGIAPGSGDPIFVNSGGEIKYEPWLKNSAKSNSRYCCDFFNSSILNRFFSLRHFLKNFLF